MHVEVLERIDFCRGCPTQSLDIIDEQHGLALCSTRLGKILLVDIVRLWNVGHHWRKVNPIILVENTTTNQWDGYSLILLLGRTCSCILADAWETGGDGSIGCQTKLAGKVIRQLQGGCIIQFILGYVLCFDAVLGSNNRTISSSGVCFIVTHVESWETWSRNLLGRHAVVLQSTTIEHLELRTYLPFIGKVECQLVLWTLGVFRTQLIIAESLRTTGCLCRIKRIDIHLAQCARISFYGACPLERRRIVIEMVIPLVQTNH